MSDERNAAFNRIMGLGAMPPDDSPDYDCWLFAETWQAAIQAERERCAKIAAREQRHWVNPETETALLNVEDAIRRGEGV